MYYYHYVSFYNPHEPGLTTIGVGKLRVILRAPAGACSTWSSLPFSRASFFSPMVMFTFLERRRRQQKETSSPTEIG